MAIRKIVEIGDDKLRKVCKPVEKFDKRLKALLDDMADTMYKAEGVGLAGPQVGILRRVAVIDVGDGLFKMVNPVIVSKSGPYEVEEGCLSLTGVRKCTRYRDIEVSYLDAAFIQRRQKYSNWIAQIIQHEVDHCNGVII